MYYKQAVQLEPDIESHVTSGDHQETGESGSVDEDGL